MRLLPAWLARVRSSLTQLQCGALMPFVTNPPTHTTQCRCVRRYVSKYRAQDTRLAGVILQAPVRACEAMLHVGPAACVCVCVVPARCMCVGIVLSRLESQTLPHNRQVSDREYLGTLPAWGRKVAEAQKLVQQGLGSTVVFRCAGTDQVPALVRGRGAGVADCASTRARPAHTFTHTRRATDWDGAAVTAARLVSLCCAGGDDDMFSTDLSLEELRVRAGPASEGAALACASMCAPAMCSAGAAVCGCAGQQGCPLCTAFVLLECRTHPHPHAATYARTHTYAGDPGSAARDVVPHPAVWR
jgi:hypothetical protein